MGSKIIPAILTNNLLDLKKKLKKITNLTRWLQLDIIDGRFVKNKSISLVNLKKIKIPFHLEIHLMVLNPEKYFKDCQELKAKRVIFHFEATKKPREILEAMGKYDFEKGIAINPGTPVEKVKTFLDKLDLVLLLAVNPGFQGQKFQPKIFKKIQELKKLSKKIKIGVDGGINLSNIKKITQAGVDDLVVGSYLFQSKNIKKIFKELKLEITRLF